MRFSRIAVQYRVSTSSERHLPRAAASPRKLFNISQSSLRGLAAPSSHQYFPSKLTSTAHRSLGLALREKEFRVKMTEYVSRYTKSILSAALLQEIQLCGPTVLPSFAALSIRVSRSILFWTSICTALSKCKTVPRLIRSRLGAPELHRVLLE